MMMSFSLQDNCQFVHNWDQAHSNGDGVGPTTFSLLSAWARGYKTFFVLNSIEHEISNAHKYKNIKKFSFCQAQVSGEGYFSCS